MAANAEGHGPRWWPPVAIAIAAFAAIAIYLGAFRSQPIRNLGTDSFGYVAQIRAARSGVLDLQEERPGVAVTGALLDGIGVAAPLATPILLSISLAVCLGLAAGALTQTAFRLPAWTIAPIAVAVATWGGTARLAAGYLANLLSLALFLAGVGVIVLRTRWASPIATVLFAGALLGHPGLLPAYAAIVVVWELVSIPSSRRAGLPFLRSEAAVAAGSLAIGAAMMFLVGAALGIGPGDVADFAGVRGRFDERAAEIVTWISPWITVPVAAVGAFIVWRLPSSTTASNARRLGTAWLAVSLAGLPLFLLFPRWPLHRTVPLGVSAAILIGVAIAWAPRLIPSGTIRSLGTGSVAIALAMVVGVVMLLPFSARASRDVSSIPPTAATIGGYLHAARVDRPVVIVIDPSTAGGVRDWKRRQNAVRALAPTSIIPNVVVYLGDERQLAAGRPTLRSGNAFAELFDLVSRRTWPAVRDVLDEDPVILAARPWVRATTWERIASGSGAEELVILRGPTVVSAFAPIAEAPASGEAAVRIATILLLLAAAGGGWTRLAGASPALRAGLAPAFGLVAVVVATITVAVAGADPGGPAGIVATAVGGLIGWLLPLGTRADEARSFSDAVPARPSGRPARSDRPAPRGAPPSVPPG